MSIARAIIENDENLKSFLKRNQLGHGGRVTQLERLGLKKAKGFKDLLVLMLWGPGGYDVGAGVRVIITDLKKLDHFVELKASYIWDKHAVRDYSYVFRFHPERVTFDTFKPILKRFIDELKANPTSAELSIATSHIQNRYHELMTRKAGHAGWPM